MNTWPLNRYKPLVHHDSPSVVTLAALVGVVNNANVRVGKMFTTLLMGGIVVAVCFQPNAPRLFAAFCFAAVTLFHEVYLSDLDGLVYYGSAALFDLAIIIMTSGINPIPRMVVDLQKICMVSIAANLTGWIIWFYYLPPITYDTAFVAIYAWALITLIKRNKSDVGGFTMDSWLACIRFNRCPSHLGFFKYKGSI